MSSSWVEEMLLDAGLDVAGAERSRCTFGGRSGNGTARLGGAGPDLAVCARVAGPLIEVRLPARPWPFRKPVGYCVPPNGRLLRASCTRVDLRADCLLRDSSRLLVGTELAQSAPTR
jgi:hypothetical protein